MGTDFSPPRRDTFRLLGVFSLLVGGGLFAGIILQNPSAFALQFNVYGLISLISSLILGSVLVAVLRHGIPNEARTWFAFYLITALVSAAAEALQRFSVYADGAIFWATAISLGMNAAAVALYLFAVAYTRTTALRNALRVPILFLATEIVVLFYAHNGLIYQNTAEQMQLFPWGYNNLPGPLFWVDLLWIAVPYAAAVAVLIRYYRNAKNSLVRKQIQLYIAAASLPLVGGLITDGVLPALHILTPMMAMFIGALSAVIIYVGMTRYKFFQIDPSILSDNILDTMREAVIVANDKFEVEFTNREARGLLKTEHKEGEKQLLSTIFPQETWQRLEEHLTKRTPLSKEFGHLKVITADDREVPVQIASSPLHATTGYNAYVLVLSDITTLANSYNDLRSSDERIRVLLSEAQQLQKQLAAEKANVEHTVEVRTEELRTAQAKLEANEQMKNEFIALSSHNLRTPLSIIKGSLQMLDDGSLAAEKQSMLGSMKAGVSQLDVFVRDLLEIVSLESGDKVDAKPETIESIVQPVVAETSVYAADKHITFSTSLGGNGAMVAGNAALLQNCVRNLLNNALKFTDEGGRVSLDVSADDNTVKIAVTDTGIGIKEEEIPLLFTKFHRGTDYHQYDYQGAGVALYITKLIIERHGGSIDVTSELGQGSTFTLVLPKYKNML